MHAETLTAWDIYTEDSVNHQNMSTFALSNPPS